MAAVELDLRSGSWPAEVRTARELKLCGGFVSIARRIDLEAFLIGSRVRKVTFHGGDYATVTNLALPASVTEVCFVNIQIQYFDPRCLGAAVTSVTFDLNDVGVVDSVIDAAGARLRHVTFASHPRDDELRRVLGSVPLLESLSVAIVASYGVRTLTRVIPALPASLRLKLVLIFVDYIFRDADNLPTWPADLTSIVEASGGLAELVVDATGCKKVFECQAPSAATLARFARGSPRLEFVGVDAIDMDPGLRRLLPFAGVSFPQRTIMERFVTTGRFRADPKLYRDVAERMIRVANDFAPRELTLTILDLFWFPFVLAFFGPARSPVRVLHERGVTDGPVASFARTFHARRALFAFLASDVFGSRDGDGALATRVVGFALGGYHFVQPE